MTLALYIRRLNQLPHVEGIARAAHARGHAVTLLLDQSGARAGPKADQWPDAERVPARWRGWATIQPVQPAGGRTFDAVVVPAPLSLPPGWHEVWCPRGQTPVLAALQTSVTDATRFEPRGWDVFYGWSAGWRGQLPCEPAAFVPVGHPLAEHLAWIDPDEVRQAFGLPADRPVVLYLPFPFDMHEQEWRLKHLYRWSPWGDRAVVRGVRRLADRRGAWLVVSARAKTTVMPWTRRAAHVLRFGTEPGEPTALRLLRVAQLAIGHYSTACLEAAACGVPFLTLVPDRWRAYDDRMGQPWWDDMHDWPGVVWRLPLEPLTELPRHGALLPGARPAWFAGVRKPYVDCYLGGEPFRCGPRVVEDLERRVGA